MEITAENQSSLNMVMAEMLQNGLTVGNKMVGVLSEREIANWETRAQAIAEEWRWFNGEALDERDMNAAGKNREFPMVYPLQLNPFRDAARLHAYALWGMQQDTSERLVKTKSVPKLDADLQVTDEARKLAAYVDYVLADIDYENNSRAMDIDMGLSTQAVRDIVLKHNQPHCLEAQRPDSVDGNATE